MKHIIQMIEEWMDENPHADYQYDEIHDAFACLTRGEMLQIAKYLISKIELITQLQELLSV